MKRKKLVAIFASLMVALSTSIPVFAAETSKIGSEINQDIPSSYIENAIQCNSDIDPSCHGQKILKSKKQFSLMI